MGQHHTKRVVVLRLTVFVRYGLITPKIALDEEWFYDHLYRVFPERVMRTQILMSTINAIRIRYLYDIAEMFHVKHQLCRCHCFLEGF